MRTKKPKILYRYHGMELTKHKITRECMLKIEMALGSRYPDGQYNLYGDLYRCQGLGHDFYGYTTLKEAKAEAIVLVRREIYDREQWLKKI